ncbi:hypothetical protein KA005_24720, partial [bacterium]|nr:hypothetical protein [bacterium]
CVAGAVGGAVSSGLNAVYYGNTAHVFDAMLTGGISGALYGGLGKYAEDTWGDSGKNTVGCGCQGEYQFRVVLGEAVVAGVVSDVSGGSFSDAFYSSLAIGTVKWVHFNRNIFNGNDPQKARAEGVKAPDWANKNHGLGDKYVFEGHEGITNIKGDSGVLTSTPLDNPGFGESYNFAGDKHITGSTVFIRKVVAGVPHYVFDMVPFALWGNTPADLNRTLTGAHLSTILMQR